MKKRDKSGVGEPAVDHDYTWDVGSALAVILQESAGGERTYYVYGLDLMASIEGTTASVRRRSWPMALVRSQGRPRTTCLGQ